MAQAFDLSILTKQIGCPVLRALCEGREWECWNHGVLESCAGSITPALAKYARTGHPRFRFGEGDQNPCKGLPPACEVRQLISWNHGPPNHGGFQPPFDQPNQWYEDRDGSNKRYGRRTGPYSDLHPNFDWYLGNGYDGNDTPNNFPPGTTLRFRLTVVDVCNGGATIYTSKTISVNF